MSRGPKLTNLKNDNKKSYKTQTILDDSNTHALDKHEFDRHEFHRTSQKINRF